MLFLHVIKIKEREKKKRKMAKRKKNILASFLIRTRISFIRAPTQDLITFQRLYFLYHQIRA